MRDELILTNAEIVLPRQVLHGHVVVREGMIAAIEPGEARVAGAIDLGGDLLVPGLVELHSDNIERHIMPRPGVHWPELPAVLAHDAQVVTAGITTILDAIRIGDGEAHTGAGGTLGHLVETLAAAGRQGLLRAEHLLHIRAEVPDPSVVQAITPFTEDPSLRLVSLMDHSPGQRQFQDEDAWRTYYGGKYGMTHRELAAFAARQRANAERYAEPNRRRLAQLCMDRCIALASHDDTLPEHVEAAAALGITVSEFPTTLEAAALARRRGMATVAGAPNVVLGGSHSGNVAVRELAQESLVDALSSDYAPASLLHAVFLLHDALAMPLPDLFAKVSRNPARMVGLTDRGEIAVGQRADLVRLHRHRDTPVVRTVWRAGRRAA